ncbi:telomere repeat-binding factor 4-like [Cicer arietinum]|uniref:MYB transcription factor n=1 Tax=Cicer arietinum TaxID=3827 RepID=A0A1S2YV38_CICAR|nr:telomere repeat-binding factor 4-like [Cicer arietinum]XP_004510410.1 telomere repeat-binding factor 4-like [Cicer arietinum]
MGNQKLKWTQEEEEALIAGIEKYGAGKWKNILVDPQFAPLLTSRSNIDLKDKWRNMNVSNGTQSSRAPKLKAAAAPSSDIVIDDSSQNDQDVKNPPRYNAMVFEALSTLKDTNGSDLNAIANFIEQKHQVPQNFRRALSSRLRTLVNQGKLEKVQNCYKLKKEASMETKPPSPKQKDVKPQRQSSVSNDVLKEAADTAAYRVADAEHKSYLADEAVKETERLSCLAEQNDAMLLLAQKLYEQCLRGETINWT